MLKDASTTVPAVLRQAFPDAKILVAIPAFNEGATIGSVVLKARQFASEVIVVDDGSSDDTAGQPRWRGPMSSNTLEISERG